MVFSCTTTLGKLTAQVVSKGITFTNTVFNIRRYNEAGDDHGKYLMQIVTPDSPEEMADGVFVFHNPNARVKLDKKIFGNIPVTQFFYENDKISILGNETPLVARLNVSNLMAGVAERHVQECVRLYNRLSEEEFYDRFGENGE